MSTGSINISSNISRSEMILQNYPPEPASDFRSKVGNSQIYLMWTDPDKKYTTTDGHVVEWAYTRVVRKIGSFPVNENDGYVVVESSVRNQYSVEPYVDTNLINNTHYYYAAFTCSNEGVFNRESIVTDMTPLNYRIMTVKINMKNSNPETCGTYADDAIDMEASMKSSEWLEFFGYRPCLFKDGKVVEYLNPNDYTKFIDGSTADITTGNSGDVMIEYPRRGIKVSKDENRVITISMTDDPNNSDFTYYAHSLANDPVDNFYLGAYNGYFKTINNNLCLYSISGVFPEPLGTSDPYASYSTIYAKYRGSHYGNIGFYQWMYLQVMYLLQYKGNWNSQKIYGGINGDPGTMTGLLNSDGLNVYGKDEFKIFGLETIWGRGTYFNTVTTNFADDGSGKQVIKIQKQPIYSYTNSDGNTTYDNDSITEICRIEKFPSSFSYYVDCIGTSEGGFIPLKSGGSSTTYMCDGTSLNGGQYDLCAGAYNSYYPDLTGLFSLAIGTIYDSYKVYARLLYM